MKSAVLALSFLSSLAYGADYQQPRAVFIKQIDFYSGKQTYSWALATAKNVETGEVVSQEREIDPYWVEAIRDTESGKWYQESNGVIFLQPGTYEFSGSDSFCFFAKQEVEIKADTHVIELKIGCE